MLFLLVLFRVLLRKPWAAAAAVLVVNFALSLPRTAGGFSPSFLIGMLGSAAGLAVLVRFGMLAQLTGSFVATLLTSFPISSNLSAWYAGCGLYALAVVAAIAAYGFHCSLAGQPAFGHGLIQDS